MLQPQIRTVAIVGVGLIGGSFALALRKAGFTGRIIGVSSQRTIERALSMGVIDEAAPLAEGVAQSDLVYLAQPISRILALIPDVARAVSPHALVTDAGSTKVEIVKTASRHLPPGCFLGGHPMAGKESRGVEVASADLFMGRTYIFTPTESGDLKRPLAAEFASWIERFGSRIMTMDAAAHDEVIAFTSHLAQIASTALSATIFDHLASPEALHASGSGLRDMSRLALSSWDVWKDILSTNASLESAIDNYISTLQTIRDALVSPHTEEVFARGAKLARRIRTTHYD